MFFLSIILSFFPTLPLVWVDGPAVVETCLDLSRWGKFIFGFLSCVWWEAGEGGGRQAWIGLGGWSEKFFNRSPITLKFEAEKKERESQA